VPRFGVVRVTLWLEGSGGQLDPVQAHVPWPLTAGALLNALSEGPTERQSDQGLVSPASAVGPLTSGRPDHGVVPVYLPQSFENLDGNDQLIAVAQVVFTITQLPGIKGVVFWLAGQRARVPDAAGELIGGPLTRADYKALTH
jgi:spore germination protein GerM